MSGEYDWKGPFVCTGAKLYYRPVIEYHIAEAVALMASTLERPGMESWEQLKVYMPKEWKVAINEHTGEVAEWAPRGSFAQRDP